MYEQSNLGPHCLPQRLLKHFSRREKQTTFVAIGALRAKCKRACLGGGGYWKFIRPELYAEIAKETISDYKTKLFSVQVRSSLYSNTAWTK